MVPRIHVHLLVRLPASLSVAKALELMKTNSSRWIHQKRILHPSFAWQAGYAAFSVSESQISSVARYIANQEEHHRKVTFEEELLVFFKKCTIPYDEKYLWK